MGFPVTIIQISHKLEIAVDWLKYAWHSTRFFKHDELFKCHLFLKKIIILSMVCVIGFEGFWLH